MKTPLAHNAQKGHALCSIAVNKTDKHHENSIIHRQKEKTRTYLENFLCALSQELGASWALCPTWDAIDGMHFRFPYSFSFLPWCLEAQTAVELRPLEGGRCPGKKKPSVSAVLARRSTWQPICLYSLLSYPLLLLYLVVI